MAELTPMMQQYMQTKKEYPDCILFYRLGDFYEMFFDDALIASKELEITLTGKNCGLEERAPMCGVPYHSVDGYLNRLVSKGYKVAICEQTEDPSTAKGLVKREVVRIVTPGTNLDTQSLDETRNNYIMSVVYIADRFGMSIADITTGDYFVTEIGDSEKLFDEIFKFMPSELICNEAFYMSGMDLDLFSCQCDGRVGAFRFRQWDHCGRSFVKILVRNAETRSVSYDETFRLYDWKVYVA